MNVTQTGNSIVARSIVKNYEGKGKTPALDGFNLEVAYGYVCALLGPNGAGKTIAVKILATLLDFDEGQASVAGFDVKNQARQVRENIGLVGQFAAVDEILTGRQNLVMFGQLQHLASSQARQRADELLEQFGLTDAGGMSVSKYSGGMRRRLDLATSLITSPAVLFVDEPTTGLDPLARRQVWAAIRELVAAGTTVLLTTQYLEEADQIADRVSILKQGRVIAQGTPNELKASMGGDWLDILLRTDVDMNRVTALLEPIASGNIRIDAATNRISAPVHDRTQALIAVASALSEAHIEPEDISLRRPTLDEVFIHLTGSAGRDNPMEAAG